MSIRETSYRGLAVNVTNAVPHIDAVRCLPEPTFLVTSDGIVSDANPAGLQMVGLAIIDQDLRLASLVENSEAQVTSLLRLGTEGRSSIGGKIVWRTPKGPKSCQMTAWCARPADEGRTALIVIRCDSDDQANRLRELNEQLDTLKNELVARRQVERGLVGALKARDDFVGIAAHELRNPLNVFHLTLQLLYRMPVRSGNDIRGVLDRLRVQLNRINSLVDHLLDVTRIRAGKLELELETFDLSELIKEIVHRFAELHPDIPLMVRVNGAAAGTWDRFRIDQAVSNLISNAIKYGLHKPVTVAVSVDDKKACVAVQDQGIGIAPGDAERIFERFERAVSHSNTEGLGLGLWIAKGVVEAHGGLIIAEGHEGQGAVFTIQLPLSKEQHA
jgi:signal transduction histidine kinase